MYDVTIILFICDGISKKPDGNTVIVMYVENTDEHRVNSDSDLVCFINLIIGIKNN